MSGKRIALGIGASLLDRVTMALVQLALVPILATHWGLEQYGSWAMLLTLPGLLVLSDLGFGGAAVVRVTMEVARGECSEARTTIASATQVIAAACAGLMLLVGLAVLVLPAAWLPTFAGTSPGDLRGAIMALTAYTCLVLCGSLLTAIFRSHGRYAQGVLLSTGTFLLENVLLVIVVLLGHGLLAAALATLTGRAVGFTLALASAARLRTGLLPTLHGGSAERRRALFVPAVAAMSIPLATALLLQGTVSALGLVAGAALVPAFVAARTLSRLGLQAVQTLTGALMPEFGAATARGEDQAVRRMALTLLGASAAIALPFAAALALLGPWFVDLWSNHQISVSPGLMAAIAVSALAGSLWKPLSDLILAANRQSAFAWPYALIAAAGVGFTLLTAGHLGSLAPALALALADIVMLVVIGRFVRRNWLPAGTVGPALSDARQNLAGLIKRAVQPLQPR